MGRFRARRDEPVSSRYTRLLSDRPFVQLLVTGGGSFAAPTASLVILLWSLPHAYAGQSHSETYGAIALALLGLSSTVPTLVSALFSGTLADRIDRRRLMIVVNLLSLLATLGIALDFARPPGGQVSVPGFSGFYLPVWILAIYPLWAVETVGVTIFRPAFNASLPRLVGRADLGAANGLVYAAALLLSVGGSLLSSGSIAFVGAAPAFVVPVALFATTQVALLGLQGNFAPAADRARRKFLTDAAAGYRYLWERKALLELTLAAVAINFLSAVAFVELGLYVTFWLGLSNALFVGLMISGGSLGAAAGTLAVGRLGFERRAGRFLVALTALQGVTVVILGLVRTPWAAIPDMFMFGVFPGMFTTVFFATVQATVPDDRLGRVLAADEVGSYSMVPVGQYAGGLLTVAAGIQVTYLTAGIGTVAIAGVMGALPELRRIAFEPNDPPAPPVEPSPTPGVEPVTP